MAEIFVYPLVAKRATNEQYDIISTVKTLGVEEPKGDSHQPSRNTTVVPAKCGDVPERENMFQKAARLDPKMGG